MAFRSAAIQERRHVPPAAVSGRWAESPRAIVSALTNSSTASAPSKFRAALVLLVLALSGLAGSALISCADPERTRVLASLEERIQRGDWRTVFPDLIALRDRPILDAVPLLARVMSHERGATRIFRYAAAQALCAIGTQQATQVLEEEASRADFDGRPAFDFAFHWDMEPKLRDLFLTRYVLRDAGEAPRLVLRLAGSDAADRRRLEFDLDLSNDSERVMEVMDPGRRGGEVLVFRHVDGRVARTEWPGTCEHLFARPTTLAPGETRSIRLAVEIVPAGSVATVLPGWIPADGVAGRSGGYVYVLGHPGAYEVVARWTSARGRSVSPPVRVHIPPPD
jgi:hypothetical protein